MKIIHKIHIIYSFLYVRHWNDEYIPNKLLLYFCRMERMKKKMNQHRGDLTLILD